MIHTTIHHYYCSTKEIIKRSFGTPSCYDQPISGLTKLNAVFLPESLLHTHWTAGGARAGTAAATLTGSSSSKSSIVGPGVQTIS